MDNIGHYQAHRVERERTAKEKASQSLTGKSVPGLAVHEPRQGREYCNGIEHQADPAAPDALTIKPTKRVPKTAPHRAAKGDCNCRQEISCLQNRRRREHHALLWFNARGRNMPFGISATNAVYSLDHCK